jgi:tetratricopeptide (TPR) repeat protein
VRGALALALSILAAGSAQAQTPEDLFERANAAYEQGRFDEAAEGYRAVLRYRIQDPVLEYNLANAEFKLGHLGAAILHYERARRLDPTDPEIVANLEFARSFTFDRVEEPPVPAALARVARLQDTIGPDRQAWIALAFTWVVAGIVAWCSSRPGGWNARWGWTLATALLVAAASWGSWYATWQRLEGRALAVVQRDSVEVLAGPGSNNATLFTVHEGLTLLVRSEREEWLQVSLPNGLSGWIPRRAIEPV